MSNPNFLLAHRNSRYSDGMDNGQKTPRGHPSFNSYVKNLCIFVFRMDGWTDRQTETLIRCGIPSLCSSRFRVLVTCITNLILAIHTQSVNGLEEPFEDSGKKFLQPIRSGCSPFNEARCINGLSRGSLSTLIVSDLEFLEASENARAQPTTNHLTSDTTVLPTVPTHVRAHTARGFCSRHGTHLPKRTSSGFFVQVKFQIPPKTEPFGSLPFCFFCIIAEKQLYWPLV